jgi:hypothetical protein
MIEEKRESTSGYHYYESYLDCPYRWYLKYFIGLKPKALKKALFFGSLLHESLEAFWKSDRDIEKAKERFLDFYTENVSKLSENESYEANDMKLRGERFLELFPDFVEKEYPREKFTLLEVEESHLLDLYNKDGIQIQHSIRPDLVLLEKESQTAFVLDYKTTSFSKQSAFKAFASGDQATGYLWGLSKVYPDIKLFLAKPIIFYSKGNVVEIADLGEIRRTSYDLQRYQMNMLGLIMEISSKVDSLSVYPSELLFPRHGAFCGMFGCEYEDICRLKINSKDDIPLGFDCDPWVDTDNNLKVIREVYKELKDDVSR